MYCMYVTVTENRHTGLHLRDEGGGAFVPP